MVVANDRDTQAATREVQQAAYKAWSPGFVSECRMTLGADMCKYMTCVLYLCVSTYTDILYISVHMNLYGVSTYEYMYIYIYRERERQVDR